MLGKIFVPGWFINVLKKLSCDLGVKTMLRIRSGSEAFLVTFALKARKRVT